MASRPSAAVPPLSVSVASLLAAVYVLFCPPSLFHNGSPNKLQMQYSFHTNSRGFACDNVGNFEVVLADGSIVNANAEENSDLWRSLKGASGNFGFVTRIDQGMSLMSLG